MSPRSFGLSLPFLLGLAFSCGGSVAGPGDSGNGDSSRGVPGDSGGSASGDSAGGGPDASGSGAEAATAGDTGGSSGSSCTWSGGPTDHGDGQLTCYIFTSGSHLTGCGYTGTQTGTPDGTTNCGQTSFTDSVSNIAQPTYFAAYDSTPPDSLNCGLCVQISYGGNSIVATIVDDCVGCSGGTGHLDLGMSAANALGLSAANGYPMTGVTWHAVSCPVTGNIVASYNAGVVSQVYFQNVVFPVTAATSGGHTAMQAFGYWDFGTNVSGQSVILTDALGHTVTGTVPTNCGDIGVQFPHSCD
jgi:hypothetical protein